MSAMSREVGKDKQEHKADKRKDPISVFLKTHTFRKYMFLL